MSVFDFKTFENTKKFKDNELKLYQIDINPSHKDFGGFNLFSVYSDSLAEIECLVTILNQQENEINELKNELKKRVYYDVYGRGCNKCIHEKGGICEITLNGTYGADGLSWCDLKDYERCYDEKDKWY